MKKVPVLIIVLLMALSVSLSVNAQNGGQTSENNLVKIEVVGQVTISSFSVKITNKQNCSATYKLDHKDHTEEATIDANSSITITWALLGNYKFRVKALTTCTDGPDMGWVELDVFKYLPVKFGQIKIKVLTSNK